MNEFNKLRENKFKFKHHVGTKKHENLLNVRESTKSDYKTTIVKWLVASHEKNNIKSIKTE